MSTAILAEHIGKKYILKHEQAERYKTFAGALTGWARKMATPSARKEDFWALDDINFEIKQGERVGIIGRNGAGKSTLLKVLSRIVTPTKGRIEITGRVASLLEVGTGFHPELSGRENIFLNGSILGMSKTEISKKFDEIVDFAEVEKFLDTPVKRYSSGMYVRLAFAVAAHLEPEILIVDEVLAVGDAAFQKKCLGKMSDVAGQGRTVLFVSHNMQIVQKLCNKGILLHKGKMVDSGNIEQIAHTYLTSGNLNDSLIEFDPPVGDIAGQPQLLRIEYPDGNLAQEIPVGKPFQVSIKFKINKRTEHFIIALGLQTTSGVPIRTSYSAPQEIMPGEYQAIFRYDDFILASGMYPLVLGLSSYENSFFYKDNITSLQISELSSIKDDPRIIRNSGVGIILDPIDVIINKL